jgi:hypothetical protein
MVIPQLAVLDAAKSSPGELARTIVAPASSARLYRKG